MTSRERRAIHLKNIYKVRVCDDRIEIVRFRTLSDYTKMYNNTSSFKTHPGQKSYEMTYRERRALQSKNIYKVRACDERLEIARFRKRSYAQKET